jgi:hypothetical protein
MVGVLVRGREAAFSATESEELTSELLIGGGKWFIVEESSGEGREALA